MNESEIKYLSFFQELFSIPRYGGGDRAGRRLFEPLKTTEHFMSPTASIHPPISSKTPPARSTTRSTTASAIFSARRRKIRSPGCSITPSGSLPPPAPDSWYRVTIHRLVAVCRQATDKYTRVKVRARLPKEYAYIIEELIDSDEHDPNKRRYFESIINSVIETGIADRFIVALANLISRLTVNQPRHRRGTFLTAAPPRRWSWTISWTCTAWTSSGATTTFSGWALRWENLRALVNALRNSLKYGNFDMLEDGYGLNVRPLALFAMEQYGDDPCTNFLPTHVTDCVAENSDVTAKLLKGHHGHPVQAGGPAHPCATRNIKWTDGSSSESSSAPKGTVTLGGKIYRTNDISLPTVDPADPYRLSEREQQLVDQLVLSFLRSEKLQTHIRYLLERARCTACATATFSTTAVSPWSRTAAFTRDDG